MKSACYDAEKKKAFDAAATEGPDGTRTVPWPKIEAYAKGARAGPAVVCILT